jgi:hypothetical protein
MPVVAGVVDASLEAVDTVVPAPAHVPVLVVPAPVPGVEDERWG